jgi:DNA-binding NarL/FixJ family response regulator
MVVKGYTTREIAAQLDTSQSNVRTHISRAMAVFGVHTRTACVEILRDWDFTSLGSLVK